MRRTILLSLCVLLASGIARDACAQRRGGAAPGFARGAYGFNRGRPVFPYRFGYAYLPYGSGYGYAPYDLSDAYPYAPQPVVLVEQPPVAAEPPAPPVARPAGHSVVTEYKWPSVSAASSTAAPEPQSFTLVLKDGSTRSAVMVFAADDGLHYVDPDERCLRISMSQIDRDATLRLNRTRNLNLHLPAAQ